MPLTDAAPLGLAFLGLLLGMRHATDADHVIAVTTIVSRESRLAVASRIGLAWGLGHTTTVMVAGGTIILFKIAIPPRLGLMMEFAVAVVLVLLGLFTLAGVLMRREPRAGAESPIVHAHPHTHGDFVHSHPHAHILGPAHNLVSHDHVMTGLAPPTATSSSLTNSFAVGLVHGLAGSAGIALLVLSAIPQPAWATLYLAVFGLGTLIGMVMITTAIGIPVVIAAGRVGRLHRAVRVASGLLSFGFGIALAYQIGFVDGLFTATPIWTPH